MRPRSLQDMLLDIRQRTNQENSQFVTDAELTEYLNQELAELHGRLTRNQGQPFLRSQIVFDVRPPTSLYSLPSDFWAAQEVTATYGGITAPMLSFGPVQHGFLSSNIAISPFQAARYRVQANNIEFLPKTLSYTATVYYTPASIRLVNPSDVFDGYNGYEVAAIYGACATVLAKEESDPGFYLSQKERVYGHIDSLSAYRDMLQPERVQDVDESHGFGAPGRVYGWWP
ncbi:MAG: hypothetical protein FWD69_10130 [Polyangiaceae bacterium]|nr:hypothetical protein [Polyangiaceae bacterium]